MLSELDTFCELLFEASNEDRFQIMNLLVKEPMNASTLSKKVGIGTQEMSRHISRLTKSGIIRREHNGLNHITPYGRLVLGQLSGLKFVSNNRSYFDDHIVSELPESFINRLGELIESNYLDDPILVFNHVERMIKESEEYVYRITDRYLMSWFPLMDEAFLRGINYKLLSPHDVVLPPDFKWTQIVTKAYHSNLFQPKSIPRIDVFLAMSEKEVAALGFTNSRGKMDYYSFSSKDPRFHRWCLDLFNYYWVFGGGIPDTSWMVY